MILRFLRSGSSAVQCSIDTCTSSEDMRTRDVIMKVSVKVVQGKSS